MRPATKHSPVGTRLYSCGRCSGCSGRNELK